PGGPGWRPRPGVRGARRRFPGARFKCPAARGAGGRCGPLLGQRRPRLLARPGPRGPGPSPRLRAGAPAPLRPWPGGPRPAPALLPDRRKDEGRARRRGARQESPASSLDGHAGPGSGASAGGGRRQLTAQGGLPGCGKPRLTPGLRPFRAAPLFPRLGTVGGAGRFGGQLLVARRSVRVAAPPGAHGRGPPVTHCRCAKCFCYPAKRRVRRRPRSLTLLGLPEDALFHVLQWLSVGDILAVRAVHSHLKYLVDNHASVWASASFQELWPSPKNLKLFERAAEKGNFEAAVKLGIAYLYNEGPHPVQLPRVQPAQAAGSGEARWSVRHRHTWLCPAVSVSDEARAEVNGLKASRYFSLAERLSAGASPFIWLFIRPPWSVSGSCCKAVVHESLRAECQPQRAHRASILHCLGRVLSLFEDEEKKRQARDLFEESADRGCLASAYLLWESDRRTDVTDPGRSLHSFRKLRDYAAKGCWEAQLSLAKACAQGSQLGLEPGAAREVVCRLFQASRAVSKQQVFSVQKGLNDTMRYILIDWLVEVATMKDFSSLCLHLTVECVDRYLRRRLVPRYRLQLLGIACMVICTRFVSREILTIREAVWLTDNTYKYEDLVRMMGEVVSALEGRIRVPTVVDYKEVLLALAPEVPRSQHLCSFLCELSLLHTGLAAFAPARLAAAALLLARLTHAQPWPTRLWDLTGFSCEDLTPCVLSLHQNFHDDAPKDYRQVSLTAVKQRFEDKRYGEISQEEVLSYSQLCAALGVQHESPAPASFLSAGEIQAFLSSPSGRRSKRKRENGPHEDRGSLVTTPTAELSSQEETLLGSFLDWSLDCCSGYEGDQESEGEREGDVTNPSGVLDVTVVHLSPEQHCCQDSSDEEACPEDTRAPAWTAWGPSPLTPTSPGPQLSPHSRGEPGRDLTTSGYSSVSGSGSPQPPTSVTSPGGDACTPACRHPAKKSCLQCRAPGALDGSLPPRRVRRRSLNPHSTGDATDTGLLGL
ncbi:Cyclin-F, partial [Galemys pyrenaicus]